MVDYEKRLLGETAVFSLKGIINMAETAQLRKVLWNCLTQDSARRIVVDLTAVRAMSSSAISLLVGAQSMARKVKGELILTGLSPAAWRYLEQFNLHHYFTIYTTVDQALEGQPDRATGT